MELRCSLNDDVIGVNSVNDLIQIDESSREKFKIQRHLSLQQNNTHVSRIELKGKGNAQLCDNPKTVNYP